MNDNFDDAIDALLRQQFAGPAADDGFCVSVMVQLPARRRRNFWPMAAGILAGVATCWFTLSSAPIAYTGWRDWLSGEQSPSAIALFAAIVSMGILAMVWTIAEADDRYDPSSRRIVR